MEKEILHDVSDALIEKPITIEVDVFAQSFIHKKLQSIGICPTKKLFIVRPITLGSLIRISKLLLSLNIEISELKNILEASYKAMQDHSETLAKIVAIALQNNKNEPSKALIKFVLNNFSSKELMFVLNIVVKQMNVTDFMKSIVSVKGMNLLETSPKAPEEIIASGQPLEE